jgi:hypothetical protein
MTDRNKGSSNLKNAAAGPQSSPEIREKTVIAIFASRNCVPSFRVRNGPSDGLEQNVPRELVSIAVPNGGGDSQ